jgi:hypothetical protein
VTDLLIRYTMHGTGSSESSQSGSCRAEQSVDTTGTINEGSKKVSSFLTPGDRAAHNVTIQVLSDLLSSEESSQRNDTSDSSNIDGLDRQRLDSKKVCGSLNDLRHLCAQIATHPTKPLSGKVSPRPNQREATKRLNQFNKYFIDMGVPTMPSSFVKCPSQRELESEVESDQFHVSVCSLDGYDFTQEFTQIYKSRSGRESRCRDYLSVIQRALLAASASSDVRSPLLHSTSRNTLPTLSEKELDVYSQYILRVARWEASLYAGVVNETFKKQQKNVLSSNCRIEVAKHSVRTYPGSKFVPVRVFIGKTGNSFAVWIRVNAEVANLLPSNLVKSEDLAAADRRRDDLLLRASHAVYYRKYSLSMNACSALLMDTVTNSDVDARDPKTGRRLNMPPPPPPPPPKIGLGDDIRVYLSVPVGSKDINASMVEATDNLTDEHEEGRANPVDDELVADGEDDMAGVAIVRQSGSTPTCYQSARKDAASYPNDDAQAHLLKHASPCCELYGWGHNSFATLGLGQAAAQDEYVTEPRAVPMSAFMPLERIKMIACSPRHTLLLTQLGSIFVSGDNSEGALGLGDTLPRYAI